jgi:hypothetical protein
MNISNRTITFTPEHFFAENAPHLLLLILVWAALCTALTRWQKARNGGQDDEDLIKSEAADTENPGAMGPG